jgi:energy-converting hydrogenase Eha subunit G
MLGLGGECSNHPARRYFFMLSLTSYLLDFFVRRTIPTFIAMSSTSMPKIASGWVGGDLATEGRADHFVHSIIRNVIVLSGMTALSGTEGGTR